MTCPKCRTINPVGRRSCHYCKYLFRENAVENSEGTKVAEFNQRLTATSPLPDVPPVETVRPITPKVQKQIINEDELLEYEQDPDSPATFSPVGSTKPASKNYIFVIIALVAVIAVCGIAIYSQRDSAEEQTATALFSQAEQLFEDGKFTAALTSYEDFLTRYPENDLASIVATRIASLNTGLLEEEKMAIYHVERANILMEKARRAFRSRQMILPQHDNVIAYIDEILQFDHDNVDALSLREDVIRHFKNEAEKSFSANHFKSARVYFDEILKLNPEDEYARGGILALDKLSETETRKKPKRRKRTPAKSSVTKRNTPPAQSASRTAKTQTKTRPATQSSTPGTSGTAKQPSSSAKQATAKPKGGIPYDAARVKTTKWANLSGSIKKNVKVHRHTADMLVLVQPGTDNYVVLTQKADKRADIYRGVSKDIDGNPKVSWFFGHRQLSSNVASTTRLAPFFTRKFILSVRNPR